MESQVRCLLGIPLGLFGTLGLGAGVLHSIHECPQPGLRKAVAGLKGHEFMVLVLRTIALDHSAARSDLAWSRSIWPSTTRPEYSLVLERTYVRLSCWTAPTPYSGFTGRGLGFLQTTPSAQNLVRKNLKSKPFNTSTRSSLGLSAKPQTMGCRVRAPG